MSPPGVRRLVRFVLSRTLKPYLRWHLRKPRPYRFRDLELVIRPGVFHPGLFYSTRFLIEYLEGFDLRGKSVWELGSGSGLISLVAARRGARVTASDINPDAVEALRDAARKNQVSVEVIAADLFERMAGRRFDWIVINPPYYKRRPDTMAQRAWYAGERYEFFERLFAGLGGHMKTDTTACMVLADGCDVARIAALARQHGFALEQRAERRLTIEDNWIFALVRDAG